MITTVIVSIFAEAVPAGGSAPPWLPAAPAGLAAIVRPLEIDLLPGRPPEVVAAAVLAWTQLLGMVSFELFGHYVGRDHRLRRPVRVRNADGGPVGGPRSGVSRQVRLT